LSSATLTSPRGEPLLFSERGKLFGGALIPTPIKREENFRPPSAHTGGRGKKIFFPFEKKGEPEYGLLLRSASSSLRGREEREGEEGSCQLLTLRGGGGDAILPGDGCACGLF